MIAYRVQPMTTQPPAVGEEVACFRYLMDAYAYVEAWYGESCDLYEIEGEPKREYETLVQTEYQYAFGQEEDESLHVVPAVDLKIGFVRVLGRFVAEVTRTPKSRQVIWKYVPFNEGRCACC